MLLVSAAPASSDAAHGNCGYQESVCCSDMHNAACTGRQLSARVGERRPHVLAAVLGPEAANQRRGPTRIAGAAQARPLLLLQLHTVSDTQSVLQVNLGTKLGIPRSSVICLLHTVS
jgi:hypothetical protein